MKTMFNRASFALLSRRSSKEEGLVTSNHDLMNEYLLWKQSYSKSAHQAYRVWVARFQSFVNKPPEEINHRDYVSFATSLQGRHAPQGITFALNVVHNYLRFFAEQGRLRFPLYLARVPRSSVNSHAAITEEQYQKIVGYLRVQGRSRFRDLAMIMMLHDTGMRIGELLSLEIEDIEENRSAVIHTEKSTRKRRIFWNADTAEVLQHYLVQRINQGSASSSDKEALFVSSLSKEGAKTLSSRTVERMFQRVLQSVGIPEGLLARHIAALEHKDRGGHDRLLSLRLASLKSVIHLRFGLPTVVGVWKFLPEFSVRQPG